MIGEEFDGRTAAIRRLGMRFKTFVLGYGEDEKVNGSSIGYCSEVEFQRHKTGEEHENHEENSNRHDTVAKLAVGDKILRYLDGFRFDSFAQEPMHVLTPRETSYT